MFRCLPKILTLLIYVSAMVVSVVAHDPWHDHGNEHVFAHLAKTKAAETSSKKKNAHHHDHGHSHAGHTHSTKSKNHLTHQHGHDHNHSHGESCVVCDFTSLMCIEATIAQVESEGELLSQLCQAAPCNQVAFSPYMPPSRAPPVC